MFYVFLIFLLLVCIYLGQIIGLMIHCELTDELKDTKEFSYMVPLLRIIMLLYVVADCAKANKWGFFFKYLACRNKNTIIMCAMADVVPEIRRARRRKEVSRKLRRSNQATWRDIIFNSQDIIEYKYQIM